MLFFAALDLCSDLVSIGLGLCPKTAVRQMSRCLLALFLIARVVTAAEETRITVHSDKLRQEFQGLGCGAIFYEGHITSLAARGKDERQRELYDDMFAKVPTRF